jgi:hypothetical protein
MTQFGFSGLNNRINSNTGGSLKKKEPKSYLTKVGRVSDIILDSTHELFNKNGTLGEGGWSSLGNISFIDLSINGPSDGKVNVAKPLSSFNKIPPLKNELVYIISLPTVSSQNDSSNREYYYTSIISIWNTSAHNANPFYKNVTPSSTSNKTYESVLTSGNPGKVSNTPATVNLGANYIDNIIGKPLYGYMGDCILEGRFNNSIRLGQTVKKDTNNWSASGNEGDPITIIRNNLLTDKAGNPSTTENIDKDSSSVYLTSTQKIKLNPKGENYRSYSSPPDTIAQFNKPQVILASDRLVFCSKNDHILINSAKSVGLSAVESINLASNKEIILDSSKISLGNLNATEPVLLGDKTVTLLSNLLSSLSSLCSALEGSKDWPQGLPETADIIVNAASGTKGIVDQLSKTLGDLKSKVTKTV